MQDIEKPINREPSIVLSRISVQLAAWVVRKSHDAAGMKQIRVIARRVRLTGAVLIATGAIGFCAVMNGLMVMSGVSGVSGLLALVGLLVMLLSSEVSDLMTPLSPGMRAQMDHLVRHSVLAAVRSAQAKSEQRQLVYVDLLLARQDMCRRMGAVVKPQGELALRKIGGVDLFLLCQVLKGVKYHHHLRWRRLVTKTSKVLSLVAATLGTAAFGAVLITGVSQGSFSGLETAGLLLVSLVAGCLYSRYRKMEMLMMPIAGMPSHEQLFFTAGELPEVAGYVAKVSAYRQEFIWADVLLAKRAVNPRPSGRRI